MAKKGSEIERNFLVKRVPANFRQARRSALSQGYLAVDRCGCEVRVRNKGGKYYLTVKAGSGMVRDETEIPLWIGRAVTRVKKFRDVNLAS